MQLIRAGDQAEYERQHDAYQDMLSTWQEQPVEERASQPPDPPTAPVRYQVEEVREPTRVTTPFGEAIALVGNLIIRNPTDPKDISVVHQNDANLETMWVKV